jgi:hypothetical protein
MARRLMLAGLVLALLASVGWLAAALTIRLAVAGWVEARAGEGWRAEAAEIATWGFPTRFRTRIAAPALGHPAGLWAWSASEIALVQPALAPWRLRIDGPSEQVIRMPAARAAIRSGAMTVTVALDPLAGFVLTRTGAFVRDLEAEGGGGWRLSLAEGRASAVLGDGDAYEIRLEVDGLVPPGILGAAAGATGAAATLDAAGHLTFDRPLEMAAGAGPPRPIRLDLERFEAVWGDLSLRASGRLELGPDGTPEGALGIRAEDWRAMVALAVAAGAVEPRMRETTEGLLGVVAGLSGDPEIIEADLVFANGRMSLGPLPLGPAPRLVLP